MYRDVFSMVDRVHHMLSRVVSSGDVVVDATAGRGNDTLFLAQLVGELGKVWAFDIQEEACTITREKLAQEHITWANVVCANHDRLAAYVQTPIKAGIFNLGYLPGANHQMITKGETTLAALQGMMELLLPEGIIILVCYLGHDGGRCEYDMICELSESLPAANWCVEECRLLNKRLAPRIIVIKKLDN